LLAIDGGQGILLYSGGTTTTIPGLSGLDGPSLGGISPDGKAVVFSQYGRVIADKPVYPWRLYRATTATGEVSTVSTAAGLLRDEFGGDFAPDGARFVFSRLTNDFKSTHLFSAPAAGGPEDLLLAAAGEHLKHPSFSRDGSKITFISCAGGGNTGSCEGDSKVEIVNADGSARALLVATPTRKQSPRFSLEGDAVLFMEGATFATASIVRVDIASGAVTTVIPTLNTTPPTGGSQTLPITLFAVAPDGSSL
jgi:Tol biopolymer transport system component